MRHIPTAMRTIVLAFLSALSATLAAQSVPDWENPAVISHNRLPHHASLGNYSLQRNHPEVISLDGTWKFRWYDNQEHNDYARTMGVWRNAHEGMKTAVESDIKSRKVTVTATSELELGATLTLRYEITDISQNFRDGSTLQINVTADYVPHSDNIPLMPKFGMRMRVKSHLDEVSYIGRGPYENYPDRRHGSAIGRYSMFVKDFMTDYICPQDNSNRCDVSWFRLHGGKDALAVFADNPVNLRIWNCSEEDIEQARHGFELPVRDFVNVNIDSDIIGVGGNDAWGARTEPQYMVHGDEPHRLSFQIVAR